MRGKWSESDVAAKIMPWLEVNGWEAFPEVQFQSYDRRADIVGRKNGHELWVIETKTSFTLQLLEQAYKWKKWGAISFVSVAVPVSVADFAKIICEAMGIGLIRVNMGGGYFKDPEVVEITTPKAVENPRIALQGKWASVLHPDMKNYTPGSPTGFSTPYSRTMDDVKRYIKEHPGCTVTEILENVKTHYKSKGTARAVMVRALTSWERDKVNSMREGNTWRFTTKGD